MTAVTAAPSDELRACWAALVAFVENIHQPQYQLTAPQWQAAERLLAAIPHPASTVEDRILAIVLAVMLDEVDAPDLPEADWAVADRMLAEYTTHVEGK